MGSRLGIVAGGGALPRRVLEACRRDGREVFVVALEGSADPALVDDGVPHAWLRLGNAAAAFDLLRQAGVDEVVMAGHVRRPSLSELRPDLATARLAARLGLAARGDDGLLRGIVRELERAGFTVRGAEEVASGLLATEGRWGRESPDAQAEADIRRGLEVVHALGAVDVGQAAVVQQGVVLGVEAVEGTAALLQRCAGVRREGPGGVLVKAGKPGQERRADLPTVGPDTVRQAASAGLRGIAVEAGTVLVLDQDAVVAAADKAGLFVIGVVP